MTEPYSNGGYSRLRPEKIVETVEKLQRRIHERFPNAGLGRACAELAQTASETARRVERLSRPNLWLRLAIALTILLALGLAAYVVRLLASDLSLLTEQAERNQGLASTLESIVNLVILAVIAIWYLANLERGLTRRSAMAHLHELRSYAHVVDMHQLTKDPASILRLAGATASSPERTMTDFELQRYLDYCTEMLAIVGKLAALYGESTQDEQIIASASDIETLTTQLARKIWQKIMTIDGERLSEPNAAPAG